MFGSGFQPSSWGHVVISFPSHKPVITSERLATLTRSQRLPTSRSTPYHLCWFTLKIAPTPGWKTGMVYDIPCDNCGGHYFDEMENTLGWRLEQKAQNRQCWLLVNNRPKRETQHGLRKGQRSSIRGLWKGQSRQLYPRAENVQDENTANDKYVLKCNTLMEATSYGPLLILAPQVLWVILLSCLVTV